MTVWMSALHRSVEFFLLDDVETRLRSRSGDQTTRIIELKKAAHERVQFVPGFASRSSAVVSMLLLRDALTLLLRASAVEHAPSDAIDFERELARACESSRSAPRQWKELVALLGEGDSLAFDRMPLPLLRETGSVLEQTTRLLLRTTDARSVDHIRWLRRGRFAAVALLVTLALGFRIHDALATPNIALGKPVVMSSLSMQSPQGSALVDGVESGRRAPPSKKADFVVSNQEAQPRATIDLGQTYALDEIRVFNRADDNFDDGLPYTVEVSKDGSVYVPLDVRSTHFGSGILDRPWIIEAHQTPARFVRVRCIKYLALSEVEVYGK